MGSCLKIPLCGTYPKAWCTMSSIILCCFLYLVTYECKCRNLYRFASLPCPLIGELRNDNCRFALVKLTRTVYPKRAIFVTTYVTAQKQACHHVRDCTKTSISKHNLWIRQGSAKPARTAQGFVQPTYVSLFRQWRQVTCLICAHNLCWCPRIQINVLESIQLTRVLTVITILPLRSLYQVQGLKVIE